MRQWVHSAIIGGAFILITACGGGGGGGGGGGLSYSGETTAASVTEGNADELAGQSMEQTHGASQFGTLEFQKAGNGTSGALSPAYMAGVAVDLLQDDTSSTMQAAKFRAVTESGSCGGTIDAVNNSTENSIDISATFNSFCNDGVTVSGSMSMQGTLDPFSITATMSNVTISDGTETISMSGTFSFDSFTSYEMNMVAQDGDGKTYKIENLVVTVTNGLDYSDLNISGRFYHETYGYIDVSTPTALRYENGNMFPSSGVLQATGANGGMVSVTALSSTQYQLDVTTSEGGTYSETKLWTELGTGVTTVAKP